MPYAKMIKSLSGVLVVVNRLPPPLPTRMELPGVEGLDGLIVATSNAGTASAAIGFGGGGGSGIAHAVCCVARTSSNGEFGPPCDHVPLIALPSALRFPSNLPPNAGTALLTLE